MADTQDNRRVLGLASVDTCGGSGNLSAVNCLKTVIIVGYILIIRLMESIFDLEEDCIVLK